MSFQMVVEVSYQEVLIVLFLLSFMQWILCASDIEDGQGGWEKTDLMELCWLVLRVPRCNQQNMVSKSKQSHHKAYIYIHTYIYMHIYIYIWSVYKFKSDICVCTYVCILCISNIYTHVWMFMLKHLPILYCGYGYTPAAEHILRLTFLQHRGMFLSPSLTHQLGFALTDWQFSKTLCKSLLKTPLHVVIGTLKIPARWWFQKEILIFTLPGGNDPIWLIFIKWVETTN